MKIGCYIGIISEVTPSEGRFLIRVQNDEGVFDTLLYQEEDKQLRDIAELLEISMPPTQWVGKQAKLIFGPEIYSPSKYAMLYGIGNENGNLFVIPEYIFEIVPQEMCKKFYDISEVYDMVEKVEDVL